MTEPADDTPQPPEAPRPQREKNSGSYYYDDGTGYEPFNPEADEEEKDDAKNGDA